MTNYVAVSKHLHADKAFLKSNSFLHAAGEMFVPLLIDELSHVLAATTMVFRKCPSPSEQYQIGALQSVVPGKNWYVAPDGRWMGGYIPAVYRAYPFAIMPEANTGRPALHFCQDSGLLVSRTVPESLAFFEEGVELSPFVSQVLGFLQQCEQNKIVTQLAVDSLAQFKLLEPWNIKIVQNDKNTPIGEQFYRVNEEALAQMSPDDLVALLKNNALTVAYAQIFSQHRIGNLAKLYQINKEMENKHVAVELPDIDSIFGGNQLGELKFN